MVPNPMGQIRLAQANTLVSNTIYLSKHNIFFYYYYYLYSFPRYCFLMHNTLHGGFFEVTVYLLALAN